MSYLNKLNKLIDKIDPGPAEFTLIVAKNYIKPNEGQWSPNVEGDGFYANYLNRYTRREFLSAKKEWTINSAATIDNIQHQIINNIDNIFTKCSPAKSPRRTKVYKSFRAIVSENRGKIDFVNSVFDISEYYYSVTKTDSICNSHNDVHRKNIFQLLSLMEKSYGKRKAQSNG